MTKAKDLPAAEHAVNSIHSAKSIVLAGLKMFLISHVPATI
jgi:hypothetical protein